jgi:hypothetical protein
MDDLAAVLIFILVLAGLTALPTVGLLYLVGALT